MGGDRALIETAAGVHRSELAASLSAGRRVLDLDSVNAADALAYLKALPTGRFDAIVCLETLEHLPDLDAVVAELVRLAGDGTRLVLSLPNNAGMRDVAGRFPGAVVLWQYLAEGSLLLPADARPEDSADHLIVVVGVDAAELERARTGLAHAAVPDDDEYVRSLERANAELHRANQRLARDRLGVHDAAAATAETRRRRQEELEALLEQERAIAKRNHELMLQAQAALEAPRYKVVDAIRTLAFSIPGVGAFLRLRSRLLRRRST